MKALTSPPSSFSELIARWPNVSKFAEDIKAPYQTAAAMKRRDSIDPNYWPKLIETARARGIKGVTWERLAKMAAGVAN